MSDADLIAAALQMRNSVLDAFATDGDSTGFCFMVSAPLAGWLSYSGIDCCEKTVDFGFANHCFVELPDGRILDATADQFNHLLRKNKLPAIYLGKIPSIYSKWIRAVARGGKS